MAEKLVKTFEATVEYENEANEYFHEWWELSGYSNSNEWLKEFSGKRVRITIEEIEQNR